MRIGFLHLGRPEHGVCRYGRLLADEAGKRDNLDVLERHVLLTGHARHDTAALIKAAHDLSIADILHFQFTEAIWGKDSVRFHNLWNVLRHCRCPVVTTFHDTDVSSDFAVRQSPRNEGNVFSFVFQYGKRCWKHLKRHGRILLLKCGILRHFSPSNAWIRYWLLQEVDAAFVCTQEEFLRLGSMAASGKAVIIPHFIEHRQFNISRENARKTLGLEGVRVVTLLGFIYGGKGYELLIKTIPFLPEDMAIVLAGGPCSGGEEYAEHILSFAKALKVDGRVRVTGYLQEEMLEKYLMATDVAVCPYHIGFASGALSSWLSARRPIIASDLPVFREYHQLEPEAVMIFSPYTPEALANSLQKFFDMSPQAVHHRCEALSRLQKRFSMTHIFDEHLHSYQRVAG